MEISQKFMNRITIELQYLRILFLQSYYALNLLYYIKGCSGYRDAGTHK